MKNQFLSIHILTFYKKYNIMKLCKITSFIAIRQLPAGIFPRKEQLCIITQTKNGSGNY